MADEQKLSRIDESCIGDHKKLNADDECYFWREYTSGRDYHFGPGNDLISNLKKKPNSSSGELWHKKRVIEECSYFFTRAINLKWLNDATLVPIPPSKAREHPDFDDRIMRMCQGIRLDPKLDVRELVIQTKSLDAAHEARSGWPRPTVEDLLRVYRIDESLSEPSPSKIAVFDDVLTAGVHYRAVHTILRRRFEGIKIVGFFVARRVFPNPFETVDD